MASAVVADKTGAVHGENDFQVLHGDIVDNLIIGALKEGGIDRKDRDHSALGEPSGKCGAKLLGNSHVEKSVWKALGELV